MKKTTISLALCCLLSFSAFSQSIPNGGFENWMNMGSYMMPMNWDELNPMTNHASVYTCMQGSPGYSGNYYLQLTTKKVGTKIINAMAVSGVLDTNMMMPVSGFPDTARSASLTGYCQYMNSTPGMVSVLLTKWNNTMMMRDTIAYGMKMMSGMAMSWTSFSVNLTYKSGNKPDSCIIVAMASGATPAVNDYLYLDNLMFSGTVAGVENVNNISNLKVYPNPVSENLMINISLTQVSNVRLQLTNMLGQAIKEVDLGTMQSSVNYSLDTKGIAKGTYLLNIITSGGKEVRKVVIE